MPLQDHFHSPLKDRRDWHGFHHAWACMIAFELNHHLPQGYYAEPNIQFNIQIDVAAVEETSQSAVGSSLASAWSPPVPVLTVPFAIETDIVEVRIFRNENDRVLAAAIELVSPSNKDRPSAREAFVSKCASYLHGGAGLIVVDAVTERHANLHDQLLAHLQVTEGSLQNLLYAAAYRPMKLNGEIRLEIWTEELAIGTILPTLPLGLRAGPCLPVNLESTYDRTCRELRITANGA
jgi:hypothetical protein